MLQLSCEGKEPLHSIVYCRSGDTKPVIIGRDEDLKLIPIADQTAKKVSKEWATTPLLLQRRNMNNSVIPFKTRVKNELIVNAQKYRAFYLQYDYLVYLTTKYLSKKIFKKIRFLVHLRRLILCALLGFLSRRQSNRKVY